MLAELDRRIDQSLIKRTEQLRPRGFFDNLSIREIYGDYRVLPATSIISDIPLGPVDHQFPTKEEEQRIRELYSLAVIGGWSNSDLETGERTLIIDAGIEYGITEWASFWTERKLLLDLAQAISKNKQPLILDVGCGNGFLAKLLAYSSDIRAVGTDIDLGNYSDLPDTPGNVELLKRDVYDLIAEYGPSRNKEEMEAIQAYLQKIREAYSKRSGMYYHIVNHFGGAAEYGRGLEEEVAHLQHLSENHQDSPVDIVICSFMPPGVDLTPVIRDGIHPKCIVYVKEKQNLSGYGDYFLDDDKSDLSMDQLISFNPGRHYRTATRWDTFWRNDWHGFVYSNMAEREDGEIVIQLRNDINVDALPDISIPRCIWDFEIRKILWGKEFRAFNKDIEQARQDIVSDHQIGN